VLRDPAVRCGAAGVNKGEMMAKITAYKCDVCGNLSEDEPQFYFRSSESKFELRNWQEYSYIDEAICCVNCAKDALVKWIAATIEEPVVEPESKVKNVGFMGGQVI